MWVQIIVSIIIDKRFEHETDSTRAVKGTTCNVQNGNEWSLHLFKLKWLHLYGVRKTTRPTVDWVDHQYK